MRRKPILIVTALAMSAAFAIVPLAYLAGVLSMPILFFVSLATGTGGLIYDVAAQSYLPTLIDRSQLVEGNGKLQLSQSAAQVAGPGTGGALVTLLSAPIAILLDSLALLFVGLNLTRIRTPEPPPHAGRRPGMVQEIREGLRLVLRSPTLRAIGFTMATYFFFDSAINANYILFATRDLRLDAGQVGLVFALGNLGFLAGTMLSSRIARRLGIGRALIVAIGSSSLFGLLAPLAGPGFALPLLVVSRLGLAFGIPVFMINQISLRQSITPDRLLGRLTGTMKFVAVGVAPIGAIVGGLLGSSIGVHAAYGVAAVGSLVSVLWLVASPVRGLVSAPAPWRPADEVVAEAEAAAEAVAETHRATIDLRA
jgi:MFS family permease